MNEFRTLWALGVLACLGLGCGQERDSALTPAESCSVQPAAAADELTDPEVAAVEPAAQAEANLACRGAAQAPSGVCAEAISGNYAIAYELDVWWQDEVNPLAPSFDPGRGQLRVISRATLGELCDGARANAAVHVCGVQFPEIANDHAGSVLQLDVPDAAWDRPSMPTVSTGVRLSETHELTFDPIESSLGIELSELAAPWPSFEDTPFFGCSSGRSGADCFPDADGDDQPGITLVLRTHGAPTQSPERCGGWRYARMPTSPSFTDPGARALYAGLRLQLRGSQPLGADCNGGTGSLEAADVALRVLDCAMHDGSRCTVAGATYVDQNLPVFHVLAQGETPAVDAGAGLDRTPSTGPRQTAVRLADRTEHVSCSDVRAVFRE